MPNKKTYRVTWEIDIEAISAVDAARQALEIQRDRASIATVFRVVGAVGTAREIDLTHGTNKAVPRQPLDLGGRDWSEIEDELDAEARYRDEHGLAK